MEGAIQDASFDPLQYQIRHVVDIRKIPNISQIIFLFQLHHQGCHLPQSYAPY